MIPGILQLWPVAKWVLQALGLLGPEDKEKERDFKLKLMEAEANERASLIKAFAEFQGLWRPSADRVYVWANTLVALFQPALLALVYYDVIWGQRRSITAAVDLSTAGIPGLLIMAIMLFPFYGPALVSAVGGAFQAAVDLAARRTGTSIPKSITNSPAGVPFPSSPEPTSGIPPRKRPFTSDTGFRDAPPEPPGLER